MCTVAFLWNVHARAKLVIAMNRDEFKARPAQDVHRWANDAGGPLVAGKDLVSGGAWFAIGPSVFAAVTNDRGGASAAPGLRTRGELVIDAAKAPTAIAAVNQLVERPASDYGRFHLVIADANSLYWLSNADADAPISVVPVAPGAHVLGNFGLDLKTDDVVVALHPKMEAIATALTQGGLDEDTLLATLAEAMATRGPPAPCIDFGPYGTRSSAIALLFGEERLLVTDSPPTAESYRDQTPLLRDLS